MCAEIEHQTVQTTAKQRPRDQPVRPDITGEVVSCRTGGHREFTQSPAFSLDSTILGI